MANRASRAELEKLLQRWVWLWDTGDERPADDPTRLLLEETRRVLERGQPTKDPAG